MLTEEELLYLISQYPYLYDRRNMNYRNTKMKEERWNAIGIRCEMTGEEVRRKFKSFREKYIRERKLEDTVTRSGAGKSNRTKWHLFDLMSFLNDCMEPRSTNSNVPDDIICSQLEFLDEEFTDNIENSISLANINLKKSKCSNKPFNEKLEQQTKKREYYENDSDGGPEDYLSSPIIRKRKMVPESIKIDLSAVTPRANKIKNKNEPAPQIRSTLEKLTGSILQEEQRNPKHKSIYSFCEYLADEMCRLPLRDADELKMSIYGLLFEKMKSNS